MVSLVIVIPTRGRHHRLAQLAQEFAANTPPHRMLFVVDLDDVRTQQTARNLGTVVKVPSRCGYPTAVNAGIAASMEPYILVGADDIRPHRGWFERAKSHCSDEVGFVSLNDLGNEDVMAGIHATIPLVSRWYIDKYGPLYDEAFYHNGCDRDASFKAQDRGAFAYAPDAIVEHLHPNYGKAELDDTYRDGAFDADGNHHDNALLTERWNR